MKWLVIILLACLGAWIYLDARQVRTQAAQLAAEVDSLNTLLDSQKAREAYREYLRAETREYHRQQMLRCRPD